MTDDTIRHPEYRIVRLLDAIRDIPVDSRLSNGFPDYLNNVLEGRPLPPEEVNSAYSPWVLLSLVWHLSQPRTILGVEFPGGSLLNPAMVLDIVKDLPSQDKLRVLQRVQLIRDAEIVLFEDRNPRTSGSREGILK